MLTDFRCVPLSWVPPQKRSEFAPAGTCGTVATDVNWVIWRPRPLRFCQSARFTASPALRPPRSGLYQTPPSLPISTFAVFDGLNARAWKSGWRSQLMFFQCWPPSTVRKIDPAPKAELTWPATNRMSEFVGSASTTLS